MQPPKNVHVYSPGCLVSSPARGLIGQPVGHLRQPPCHIPRRRRQAAPAPLVPPPPPEMRTHRCQGRKSLFVMPQQGPQRVPLVAVLVNVRHAAPQAGLQLLRVVAEQQHDARPRQRREGGPGVVREVGAQRLARHDGQAVARLDGQARQRQAHAREDVDDDLLVDARRPARPRGPPPEDDVAAEEAGEEGVVGACSATKSAHAPCDAMRLIRGLREEYSSGHSPSLPGVGP